MIALEYLTSRDVAVRLKISVRCAQRLMKSLPHINAGLGTKRENLRISEKTLEEYQTIAYDKPRHTTAKTHVQMHRQIVHHSGTTIKKMDRR